LLLLLKLKEKFSLWMNSKWEIKFVQKRNKQTNNIEMRFETFRIVVVLFRKQKQWEMKCVCVCVCVCEWYSSISKRTQNEEICQHFQSQYFQVFFSNNSNVCFRTVVFFLFNHFILIWIWIWFKNNIFVYCKQKQKTKRKNKTNQTWNRVEKGVRNEKHSQTLKTQQQQNFIHFQIWNKTKQMTTIFWQKQIINFKFQNLWIEREKVHFWENSPSQIATNFKSLCQWESENWSCCNDT
jgi:hypothetical protein